ncbi:MULTISPECIES: hypothetical protein [unclassified Streptomyces]|uniref:hypothetical protein n=1 Tax=unclassified Streptomyces TaxID=2593676 RepID=UPI001113C83C|nr:MULTISPECIES: hypothetical protein [unclassified Streptomyces]
MVGSELAVVARAGTAVLKGVAGKAASTPEWPNFHAALMELHEILDEWLIACKGTYEFILSARGMQPEEIKEAYKRVNIRVLTFPLFSVGFLERAEKDLSRVMNPSVSVLKRWSRVRRRQAGRRTLRSMMKIYCPDLLDEFDSAVRKRAIWVRENREFARKGLRVGIPQSEMNRLASESMQTAADLEHVKMVLAAVLLERYPLGGAAPPS